MAVYTYYGNDNEDTNGTTVLKTSAGEVAMGDTVDIPEAERNVIDAAGYDLQAGTVSRATFQHPWKMTKYGPETTFFT